MRIGSQSCRLHIGAISYFRGDLLEFYWRDPKPGSEEPFDVELPKGAWRYYYEPALAMASAPEEEGAADGDASAIAATNVEVNIEPQIGDLLRAGEWDSAKAVAMERREELREEGFFPDGIAVSCGDAWGEPFGKGSIG